MSFFPRCLQSQCGWGHFRPRPSLPNCLVATFGGGLYRYKYNTDSTVKKLLLKLPYFVIFGGSLFRFPNSLRSNFGGGLFRFKHLLKFTCKQSFYIMIILIFIMSNVQVLAQSPNDVKDVQQHNDEEIHYGVYSSTSTIIINAVIKNDYCSEARKSITKCNDRKVYFHETNEQISSVVIARHLDWTSILQHSSHYHPNQAKTIDFTGLLSNVLNQDLDLPTRSCNSTRPTSSGIKEPSELIKSKKKLVYS